MSKNQQPVIIQQGASPVLGYVLVAIVIGFIYLSSQGNGKTAVSLPALPQGQAIIATAVPPSFSGQPAPAAGQNAETAVSAPGQPAPPDLNAGGGAPAAGRILDLVQPVADPNVGGGAPNGQPLGGINNGTDPNVGGGVPANGRPANPIISNQQTAVSVEPTFTPDSDTCNATLWANELPEAGCFARWKYQQQQGQLTELDLYKAQAPANCQQLSDDQEPYCLVAIEATMNYIISQMENQP